MSGILEGKRILITGVLTESSIAFHTAKLAQEQGAEIILTAFPRPTLTERIAKKLPKPTKVIELDVTNDEHLGRRRGRKSPRVNARPERGALQTLMPQPPPRAPQQHKTG
ncbi:SDR family oxidoreductase, partial [Streptomyces sp. NPDC006265]|uniref:SDR family oxidoreductase n=1 Tax=Streptomyces sp. NPDC006265 TaxID=3156740 RepID=UPI0033B58DC9